MRAHYDILRSSEQIAMAIELDHMILAVNDRAKSIAFYGDILGLRHEGEDGPFSILRVPPDFFILLAPWGTPGGEHLAFSMSKAEFDVVFQRLKDAGIPYGDQFDQVGNMKGPAPERGAQGLGNAVYFFDPDKHLLEIRHYDAP
jgi:catechol 2,3-dioxygenase-like lactoylglutathione lyase family enzyme